MRASSGTQEIPSCCGHEVDPQGEQTKLMKLFKQSIIFSIPLFLISMAEMLPGMPLMRFIEPTVLRWIEFFLSTPVVIWCGSLLFQRGWQSILDRNFNMFTLISIGVAVAYGFSAAITIFGLSFSEGVYFESAATIVSLVLLGQVLELKVTTRAKASLETLLALAPKKARVVRAEGREIDIDVEFVRVGDILRVKPGEKIPVDGILVEGSSTVIESMITGEAFPVEKLLGQKLIGGTLNVSGSFLMRAEHVGKNTYFSRIVKLVNDAQNSKAPIQKVADQVASFFVPTVVLFAALTALFWLYAGNERHYDLAILNAISVLIVACPCVLGLATPLSVMAATGQGARSGVLYKNAESLERLSKVTTLVIDKTGTLTEGKPKLISVFPSNDHTEKSILELAATLEKGSEHPLASAFASIETKKISVDDFIATPGCGIEGGISGQKYFIGSAKFLSQKGINASIEVQRCASKFQKDGQTLIYLFDEKSVLGVFGIADTVRTEARDTVGGLQKKGIRVVMATGDHEIAARKIAQEVGVSEIHFSVLPEGKLELVQTLQASGETVAMAGDGINDAPALARADVGIAMGGGTDVAMESAGIVIMQADLKGVLRAYSLSKLAMRNIKQNLFFSFVYNLISIPIAAGFLFPRFGILLNPMIASLGMSLSSISVVLNSLRLRWITF